MLIAELANIMVKITVKIVLAIRENPLNPFHPCSHPA